MQLLLDLESFGIVLSKEMGFLSRKDKGMKRGRRLLSVFMALVLSVSMMPAAAFAAIEVASDGDVEAGSSEVEGQDEAIELGSSTPESADQQVAPEVRADDVPEAGAKEVASTDGGGDVEDSDEPDEAALEPAEDEPETSGTCGDNLTWIFANGTLTISGTGDMDFYPYDEVEGGYVYNMPWEDLLLDITNVVIEDGVTDIGDSAFAGCTNLASVTIPSSVMYIGSQAFFGCESLESVEIPSSVTYIGDYAFGYYSDDSGYYDDEGDFYYYRDYDESGDDGSYGYPMMSNGDDELIPVIHGYPGTAAYEYARDNNLRFVSLVTYTITYRLNGGTNSKSNPSTYDGTESVLIQSPTRNGYIFTGWDCESTDGSEDYYLDDYYGPGESYIAEESSGNLVLTANWEKIETPEVVSVAKSGSGVKVSWSESYYSDEYEVYRKAGSGKYSRIATVDYDTFSYNDKSAKPGVKYTYRVRSVVATYYYDYDGNESAVKSYSAYSNEKACTLPKASITYRTHVQTYGWQKWKKDGATSGTVGKSKRLEGINIKLSSMPYSGGITYRTHVQNIGWQGWKSNGKMAGTSGKSLRLEAIQIKLTGQMAQKYDVYYRVHCQRVGWMGWAKNGQMAGTSGYSYRLEGIQIKLVEKGGKAPGSTANCYKSRK